MLGGQGADFPSRVAFWASDLQFWEYDFVWQVQHFIWPGITFSWQAQYFRDVDRKIAKRIATRPLALHSTFHYWRKSCRIASFLILSPGKNEEVSQNCFAFALVNFENWESLADFFAQTMLSSLDITSRRLASFLMVSQLHFHMSRKFVSKSLGKSRRIASF